MVSGKILNIVLNNFINDARVLKTSRSLYSTGNFVDVLALHKSGLPEHEIIDGLEVHRLKLLTKNLPKTKFFQLIKYLEFLFRSSIKYQNKYYAVHCNDLSALPIGYLLKKFSKNKVKIVYDAHEYETERDGMKPLMKKILKFFERRLIIHADNVICVSNEIANCYVKDYGISKPDLVLNCPYLKRQPKQNLFRDALGIRSDQKIFLYQGGLKSGRGIELLIEAFAKFEQDKNILLFLGFGPLESLIKNMSKKHSNILFHSEVPQKDLLRYTSSADYGVLFYEDTCLNHRYCSPNKMFEYLMAGLPVITSNLYEMKRLVESEGIGIVAKENTISGFNKALKSSLKQNYKKIQDNVEKVRMKYCWEEQEKSLLSIYEKL